MVKVTLKDNVVKEFENGITAADVAKSLGMGLYKAACACKVNGTVCDLRTAINEDCTLDILTFDDKDGQKAFWHTTSHILAQAVKRLFPKAKFAIGGESGEDFAYLPVVERDTCVTISQLSLRQVILQTIFSIASGETNKLMTGELFEIKNDRLRVISLDGHRISIRRVDLKESNTNNKVIVPGKTRQEISKIMTGDHDDMVNIYITENHILFEMPDTTIVSRLIDGEYFAVDQMISGDYESKVRINKKTFQDCIDRATLFVKEGDKKPIILDFTEGNCNLSIESPLGAMNEDIDIEKDGKDLTIGFNPRFMIDALKAIEDEDITLYMTNAKSPCFIRDDEDNYTYLVLPVNFTR